MIDGDDDDDFMPFEDYCEMSEAETDRLLLSLQNQYNEMIERMPARQRYEYFRSRRLELCVNQRRLAKTFPEIFLPKLRATQRRLLELRIEHRTGAAVGHA